MERKGGSLTQRGKVADRIAPTDVIGRQERLSHGAYSTFLGNMGPPFELPVVYEDDHFAIVNKPSGVVVYDNGGFGSESKGRKHGRNTIKYALPFVLTPPPSQKQQSSRGLWRPIACHRLDKPTSGLLVVAKTRDAATHVTRQFEERIVQKTYTAIVDGSPLEDFDSSISSMKVYELGGEVDPTSNSRWQIDEGVQEGKEATTFGGH